MVATVTPQQQLQVEWITTFLASHLQSYHCRLIIYLAIFDFFWAITIVPQTAKVIVGIPLNARPVLCDVVGVFTNFFKLCQNVWNGFIALTLLLEVIWHVSTKPAEFYSLAATILVSALNSILGGTLFTNGPVGAWCFETNIIAQQGLFYYVIYMVMIVILVSYVWIIQWVLRLSASDSGEASAQMKKVIQRLVFYPIAFLIVWLPAIIRRAYEAQYGFCYPLFIIMGISIPMEGIMNFAAFANNHRTRIHEIFSSYWGSISAKKDMSVEIPSTDSVVV